MMNTKYKHIFFDLDRTLWDFEKSAEQAFEVIFEKYHLKDIGVKNGAHFHELYTKHNNQLWDLYRLGKVTKDVLKGKRFFLTLKDFGVEDKELAENIGEEYTTISPKLVNLFPNALEILEYLYPKYKLHIITNGFSEVQDVKLRSSGMGKYFDKVITSEDAGVKKPESGIFSFAIEKTSAKVDESIMVGDDYKVDIVGAQVFGMDQIFFNPQRVNGVGTCTFEIVDLIELKGVL